MSHPHDRLSAFLDGELPAPERAEVEGHLRTCAECARALEDLAAVDAMARSLHQERIRTRRRDPSPAWPYEGFARCRGFQRRAPEPVLDQSSGSHHSAERLDQRQQCLHASGHPPSIRAWGVRSGAESAIRAEHAGERSCGGELSPTHPGTWLGQ